MSKIRLATVLDPETNCLHIDDPTDVEPQYGSIVMDIDRFMSALGGKSKTASTASLHEIFYNTQDEENGIAAEDMANDYYDKIAQSRSASTKAEQLDRARALMGDKKNRDFESLLATALTHGYAQMQTRSKAGAIITSLDFPESQDSPFLGENLETNIRTGILASLFQTVAMPVLSGKWRSATSNDLKYYRNLAESQSPKPSKGVGAVTTVTIQKHGGAVAITQRAQAVINQDNPFQRLVTQMGQKKLFDENDMIADEIELNTANTYAGVDFGLRSGTPPLSSTNPVDFLTSTVNTFEGLSQNINLFVSRGFMYWEYAFNDIIRGGALAGNPAPPQGNINEQVSPFPGLDGVRWARDNAITSATAGWAMNDNAIKLFRGPSRNYTIADEDTETTKYVTKNYFKPTTVDATLIYKVTGIAA